MVAHGAARPVRSGFRFMLRSYGPWFLMVAPGLVYYLIFRYGPLYGLVMAFQEYNIFEGIRGSTFVGLENFRTLFDNPEFGRIMRNTLVLSGLKLLFGMPPAILLALALNEVRVMWFKRFVQTVSYLPYFLSWVMIYGILFALLSPGSGLINQWIRTAGGSPVPFLTDGTWFRAVLILSDIWKEVGWGAIIYLAALGGISPELYEAARVDGAGKFKQIWHISLPGISHVIVLLLILRLGQVLDAGFEQVYILYNSQVHDVADIIDTWVFRNGIEQMRYSLATAAGLFKSAVGLALVLVSNYLAKRWSGQGLW